MMFCQRTGPLYGNSDQKNLVAPNMGETVLTLMAIRRINFRPLATPPNCNAPSLEFNSTGYAIRGAVGLSGQEMRILLRYRKGRSVKTDALNLGIQATYKTNRIGIVAQRILERVRFVSRSA